MRAKSWVRGSRVIAGAAGARQKKSRERVGFISPAKVTSATRVLRGSSSRRSRRAAATSAARIESPGSSPAASKSELTGPRYGEPIRPLPFTSAPVGSIVESEVSITIATSKPRSSPVSARARPDTKMPQAEGGMELASAGRFTSSWTRVVCGSEGWISLAPAGASGNAGAAKLAKGRPAPCSSGCASAPSSAPIGVTPTRVVGASGAPGSSVPSRLPRAASSTGAPAQPSSETGRSSSSSKCSGVTRTMRPKRSSCSADALARPSTRTRVPTAGVVPMSGASTDTPVGRASSA